jgi:hypothetical protein
MAILTKVKSFFSSWQNVLALGTLIPLGAWIYSRVWMVNPAILGDEYLYSMNSRKAAPWDPSPAGDFSNYLFNFVYQGTNLCGQAFYSCAKVFNIVFFLGFIFTLFIVAIRFLPFWAAYCFMIAAALSPLSVYTSMFLPESMYMFFIGLLLVAVLHAMNEFTWQNWAIAGAAIGIASLVKPHAWLSAIAVGITLLAVGLGNREIRFKKTSIAIMALIAGSALGRVTLGLIVAGPKALGFFGQYLGFGVIEEVIAPTAGANNEQALGTSPLDGVFELFGTQLGIHLMVISALMAIAVVALFSSVISVAIEGKSNSTSRFALFSFIWLFSLMIEIVIFTGWVTGSGDDHTTRVLLRYYEFLFVIVPLAGLSVLNHKSVQHTNVWIRWGLSLVFAFLLTPAFTGSFASLTIQIADAPTLAGLVVNQDVFNAVAVVGFLALLVFATFPKFAPWTIVLLLPVSMIGTGLQIQEQYQEFRGSLNPADRAGIYLRDNFKIDEINETWILAPSRFEATNIAFWADSSLLGYDIVNSGSTIVSGSVVNGKRFVVTTGGIAISDYVRIIMSADGFVVYELPN